MTPADDGLDPPESCHHACLKPNASQAIGVQGWTSAPQRKLLARADGYGAC